MASTQTFKEIQGDLFSSEPDTSLAHCISRDAHMGKGIAVLFAKKFKQREEIRKMGVGIGGVAAIAEGNRYIYNLITKEKYYGKPTYDSLKSSLEAMKTHAVQHSVSKIAMPKVGCGLDRLDWNKVFPMIKTIFADTNISIDVYYLE